LGVANPQAAWAQERQKMMDVLVDRLGKFFPICLAKKTTIGPVFVTKYDVPG